MLRTMKSVFGGIFFEIFYIFFILGGDGERWQLFALFTLKPTLHKNKSGNDVLFCLVFALYSVFLTVRAPRDIGVWFTLTLKAL